MKKQYFIFALLFFAAAVFYLAASTPITPYEAKLFFTSNDVVGILMRLGESLNIGFLGPRIFSVTFGFVSIALFYAAAKGYFLKDEDAYLATTIFMYLPGILTASVLVNVAIIVLPLVLLFVLFYERGAFWILPLIMLTIFFIHEASIIFFAALLMYAYVHKDRKLMVVSLAFLFAFIYLEKGIEIGGRPSGHFIEIFGLYATVFSPFVFLYFFYVMYRILLREKKTLLWYISFTALAFSLLLSLRQKIQITDFAPYVMISVLVMLDTFNRSVRVRLPQFQKRYRWGFYVVTGFLALTVFVTIFHKVSYDLSNDPGKHFAKRVYEPYILAQSLKSKGVRCYDGSVGSKYQLRYYSIPPCKNKPTVPSR